MRSFIILTISFAAMCLYLDQATQQHAAKTLAIPALAKVVRVQTLEPSAAPENSQVARATIETKKPKIFSLDLSLPSLDSPEEENTIITEASHHSWFKKSDRKGVRYNASLLFDEKKGTSIRGGQLNITIPMG